MAISVLSPKEAGPPTAALQGQLLDFEHGPSQGVWWKGGRSPCTHPRANTAKAHSLSSTLTKCQSSVLLIPDGFFYYWDELEKWNSVITALQMTDSLFPVGCWHCLKEGVRCMAEVTGSMLWLHRTDCTVASETSHSGTSCAPRGTLSQGTQPTVGLQCHGTS